MAKQDFINAGFTVLGTENNENKLLRFLKEHYPNVIRDTEINLEELKTVLGLPIDEKVNGYGLNFVGRNFARAKYAQKTEKELRLYKTLSKNIDTTQNLVLKGDNLDSLKILKNHYSGKIKCIYIDPPYNTTSDEFVYPDKFNKEEAEVLGLANLSESDFARMDFSFKTKKSHNGWLAFMYPRLLLARDLLSKDGVIFISIDDNEQANLKLLCDDVFGEENFVGQLIWKSRQNKDNRNVTGLSIDHEYVLCYSKSINERVLQGTERKTEQYSNPDNDPRGEWVSGNMVGLLGEELRPNCHFDLINPETKINYGKPKLGWRYDKNTMNRLIAEKRILWPTSIDGRPRRKVFLSEVSSQLPNYTSIIGEKIYTRDGTGEFDNLFGTKYFDFPKPSKLIKELINQVCDNLENSLVLDFFAGSGTTGHAVMQLNAEDGGNRKFILCQIDEPIKEDKPAYKFCIDNNLPPVISSITIERLKRAGEKIKNSLNRDLPDSRDSNDLSSDNQGNQTNQNNHSSDNNQKNHSLDIGFKVFDSVEAPKLELKDGMIQFPEISDDAISRIYNMIFTVGLDEPTQVPEEVVKDCIYKIGNHYYNTNSENITSEDYSNAIKNGKVFIDGWTASLNGTLQNYKEDVQIVF